MEKDEEGANCLLCSLGWKIKRCTRVTGAEGWGGGWGGSLNLFVQKREVKGVPSILVGKSRVLSKERKGP